MTGVQTCALPIFERDAMAYRGGDNTTEPHWLQADAANNESEIRAYEAGEGDGTTGSKYLHVNTGSTAIEATVQELTVEDDTIQQTPKLLVDTDNDAVYVDTMVQFTESDIAPTVTAHVDKLAVWLAGADYAGGPGLKVTALGYDNGVAGPTVYDLNTNLVAESWYKLTIKTVVKEFDGVPYQCFRIYLGGTELRADTAGTRISDDTGLFFSLRTNDGSYADNGLDESTNLAKASITSVAFVGEGNIDNLVIDDVDAYPEEHVGPVTYGFTVTAPNCTVVDYESGLPLQATYESGDTVAARITPDANYTVTEILVNGVDVIDNEEYTFVEGGAYVVTVEVAANVALTVTTTGGGGETPTINPESGSTTAVVTAGTAEAAINAVVVQPPADAVTAGLTPAAYKEYFTFETTDNGNGTFTVTATGLDTTKLDLDDTVEDVAESLSTVAAATGATDVGVAAKPGLYYSIASGTSLEGMQERGTRVLATDTTVTLTIPAPGTGTTAGFYKVIVSTAPLAQE